ncbi:thiamine pyrophosphate-binding protein [Methylobacterium sp. BTF04]|uniref:thiamine pyrophosphate-binding protein n=1 Tax=Methylobacterium sp. BTF04 TaxID=2708300 RepID=UPI0013D8763F|nr:thiamine pyrophosphate-binding protein [Methylobacterium sp. BTF04]NEU12963.1 thiamine pyrophosphate-binding protein [Methylobacterium sp. BTF04]
MRVADLIARIVIDSGISRAFMVTGGGAMHLNDAFCRAPGLDVLFMHHEQACAMAAEGYARLGGAMALVNVTTGPGGINALNGVFGAYTDSVPMLLISGQVKTETVAAFQPLPLRQLGDQEVDILAMAAPVTKFGASLRDPADTAYLIEKAIWIARSGRPGPVWIDVPIDIQGAQVDPDRLRHFSAAKEGIASHPNEVGQLVGPDLAAAARRVLDLIGTAERPVILPGTGIRAAKAVALFERLVATLRIPVATAFNAHDLLTDDHPAYVGKAGTVGDRAGNFAVQNADLVLVLGCRLNIRQISYNWTAFARAATQVMVDIDSAELAKHTLSIDVPIQADLCEFLEALLAQAEDHAPPAAHAAYLAWCKARTARYPANLPDYAACKDPIHPYAFAGVLWDELGEGDAVVTANATACIVTFQTARLKPRQRLFSNSGSASMGYDLPAAIGAHLASDGSGRTVCMAGDGSIMMNLQELQTIVGNRLPIKIFILNNAGYSSILQSQTAWFPDNVSGCGPQSGVAFPDFQKIAAAFGIPVRRLSHLDQAAEMIRATLDEAGPSICEVMLDPAQTFAPKLSSRRLADGRMVSSALEDMAPFLSREELAENMLIPVAE